MYTIRSFMCGKCGVCISNCPERAIVKKPDRTFQIDPARCNGCGKCLEVCRFDAVRMIRSA